MNSFVRDTAYTFVARVLALGVGVATSAIVARYLGPEGRGIYALALLLPSLVVNFVHFGMGSATVYQAARREHPLKRILGGNSLVLLAASGIGLIVGAVVIMFFRDIFFEGAAKRFLLLALPLIPLDLLLSFFQPVLLGRQLFLAYNAIQFSRTALRLVAMTVLLVWLRGGTEMAILGSVAVALMSSAVLLTMVRRLAGGFEWTASRSYVREALSYGVKAYPGNVLSFLHLRVDLLLLNRYLDPTSVGFYAVAVALVDQLALISRAAATALFPRVAAGTVDGRRASLTPLVTRTVLLVSASAGAVLCLVAGPLVHLLYSETYLPVIAPLRILVIGTAAMAGARVLGNDVAGRGKPILNSYTTGIALLANIVLNVILIPRWEIVGAAWASAGTYGLLLFLRAFVYIRVSGDRWRTVLLPQRGDWLLYWTLLKRILSAMHRMSK